MPWNAFRRGAVALHGAGELALDGTISPVAGVLPAAVNASAHGRGLICPAPQGGEADWAAVTKSNRTETPHFASRNGGITPGSWSYSFTLGKGGSGSVPGCL